MQVEILAYQEYSLPEELHEGGCQQVVTSGHGASKNVGSTCSGFGHHREIEIEETDGSCSGHKKSTTSLSLFVEACGLEVEEELSTLATQFLGRRSLDRSVASSTKRSLGETDSRSSDVEASKRKWRSSDV